VIENYSKFEVRAVVRLLQAEGESEIHCRLIFMSRTFSAEKKGLYGVASLKMPE
jgi:hypothetical protein